MAVPKLYNPAIVVLEKTVKATAGGTQMDHLRREPKNFVARGLTYSFQGQIVLGNPVSGTKPVMYAAGVDDELMGYFICRTSDLSGLGLTIERGDKITTLGGKPVVFYVLTVTYHSHYNGSFSLAKVTFSDRRGDGV